MRAYANRAPKVLTVGVALLLVFVAWLGTFAGVLPEGVGELCAVLATVVLLLGVFFRRI